MKLDSMQSLVLSCHFYELLQKMCKSKYLSNYASLLIAQWNILFAPEMNLCTVQRLILHETYYFFLGTHITRWLSYCYFTASENIASGVVHIRAEIKTANDLAQKILYKISILHYYDLIKLHNSKNRSHDEFVLYLNISDGRDIF